MSGHPRHALILTAAVLTAAALGACSDDNKDNEAKPAVCNDVDSLRSSVDDLKDVQVGQGAIAEAQQDLDTIQQRLATLRADAKGQFSSEISAVDTALASLQTAVDAAKANPSAVSLAATATSARTAVDAGQALVSAVKRTC